MFIINAIFINICAVSYIHDETKEMKFRPRIKSVNKFWRYIYYV